MRLKAYYWDDTTAEADVGAAAQIALEDKYRILFTDAFDDGTDANGNKVREAKGRMTYLYYLTWAALDANGQDVGDFDDWVKNVKDAGFAQDQDGKPKANAKGNPTKRAQSRAASST